MGERDLEGGLWERGRIKEKSFSLSLGENDVVCVRFEYVCVCDLRSTGLLDTVRVGARFFRKLDLTRPSVYLDPPCFVYKII